MPPLEGVALSPELAVPVPGDSAVPLPELVAGVPLVLDALVPALLALAPPPLSVHALESATSAVPASAAFTFMIGSLGDERTDALRGSEVQPRPHFRAYLG